MNLTFSNNIYRLATTCDYIGPEPKMIAPIPLLADGTSVPGDRFSSGLNFRALIIFGETRGLLSQIA